MNTVFMSALSQSSRSFRLDRIDTLVIGAGAVGLACARERAMAGQETLVLEAANAIGTGTSSRNSEVIHAGIYYPVGSFKARLCVEGRHLLYRYAQEKNFDAKALGKLIVATQSEQLSTLHGIQDKARACGVNDLQWLSASEVQALEPELRCSAGLLSPSTGVLDTHAYMLALQGDLEAHGGMVAFESGLSSAQVVPEGIVVRAGGMEILTQELINSAGLYASVVAATVSGLEPRHVPQTRFAKGNYYSLQGKTPFQRLVYPVPENAGLGVHVTIDLGGQARFGPDVEWLTLSDPSLIDYTVDPMRAEVFYEAVRRYWPGLKDGALLPAYSGIRPKLQTPGEPALDFLFQGPSAHGVRGLVNLFGIESPGLTASLAIAKHVGRLLQ
jgi:L-2-hydroxyglutarate oxidase LhgO